MNFMCDITLESYIRLVANIVRIPHQKMCHPERATIACFYFLAAAKFSNIFSQSSNTEAPEGM